MTDERQNEQGPETPGPMLKQAREQAGLSTQQVAQRLNLRHSVVIGIERDDYEANMSITYVRGYIRNYARLVGLDEQRLNQALAHLHQPESTSAMQSFSGRTHRQKKDNRWTLISWAIFFLIAVAVLWAIFGRNEPAPEGVQPQAESIGAPLDESAPDAILERVSPEPQTSPSTAPAEPQDNVLVESADEAATDSDDAPMAIESPAVEVADPDPEPQGGTVDTVVLDRLAVSLSDDCWMLIQDADGKVLLEGLKSKGYRTDVSGKAPFSLRIGAPEVVSLSFNGDAIDLSSYRAGRVARLTLPQ